MITVWLLGGHSFLTAFLWPFLIMVIDKYLNLKSTEELKR